MIIKFDKINLNVKVPSLLPSDKTYVFFLHGFTGSADDWKTITQEINKNFIPISIDLIGHGKSDSPDELKYYQVDSLIEQLKKITSYFTNDKFILCGYSMGGRLALSFANKYPEKLKGLILESSTYGIKDKSEKDKRKQNDKELAEFIRSHSIDEFVDRWLKKGIFHSLKKLYQEKHNQLRIEKLKNNKVGLINSLLGFGTGNMHCLYNELRKFYIPTIQITGELDHKFTVINKEIEKQMPDANHLIIKNAGHNTHIEKPKVFINIVNEFLRDY